MRLLPAIMDCLWPEPCPSCGADGRPSADSVVCVDCRRALPLLPRPIKAPAGVASAWVLGPYEGPLGAMVRRAKYGPDARTAAELARRLAGAARGRLPAVALVTHVPVAPGRRWARGFDQAEVLAVQTAAAIGRVHMETLRRVTHTEQAGRTTRDRRRGARGAYAPLASLELSGPVLLIDDVITTGSTATSCADQLLASGARSVHLLCVAGAAT